MTDSPDSPVVVFQRRAGGREVALLGVIEVGDIYPISYAGRVCFGWSLMLPFVAVGQYVASIDAARGELRRKIEDWLEAAGLVAISTPRDGEIRAFRDWDEVKQAVRG